MTKNEFISNMQDLLDSYKHNTSFLRQESMEKKTDNDILKLLNSCYIQDDSVFVSCESIKKTINVNNISNKRIGLLLKSLSSNIKSKQGRVVVDNKIKNVMLYGLRVIDKHKKEVKEVKKDKEDVKEDVKEEVKDTRSLMDQFDSKK